MNRRDFLSSVVTAPAVAAVEPLQSASPATQTPSSGSLTDVPGLMVGHYTDARRPTGCTVILFEPAAAAGVDYDGSAPGESQVVLLQPVSPVDSMMSFTVTSRRREIGIRAALGADARRVLAGIFGRASAQLGAGVSVGLAIAATLEWLSGGAMMGGRGFVLLPAVMGVMFTLGLLAALGPARRGLAVQPTEALRAD